MAEGCGWNDARLASIKGTITLASFTAEGYVGLGVPLGTNTFVQKFVHDACQKVINDVDKLDHIEDGFVPLSASTLLSGNSSPIPELSRLP